MSNIKDKVNQIKQNGDQITRKAESTQKKLVDTQADNKKKNDQIKKLEKVSTPKMEVAKKYADNKGGILKAEKKEEVKEDKKEGGKMDQFKENKESMLKGDGGGSGSTDKRGRKGPSFL